jgi:uncharacterized membrane protein
LQITDDEQEKQKKAEYFYNRVWRKMIFFSGAAPSLEKGQFFSNRLKEKMTGVFNSKGVKFVTIGWVGFIAENLILSHNREYLINSYGDDNYHIVYNVLSTAACSSIAYGFFKYGKAAESKLAPRGPFLKIAGCVIQTIGLVGLSQLAPAFQIPVYFGGSPATNSRNTPPMMKEPSPEQKKLYVRCPIDFKPRNPSGELNYGMERVTRHPALWFLGLSAAGSALTTVYPTHLVFFTFPLLFAWIGSEHTDYRYRRGNGGQLTPEREAVTSNIPFLALIQGKQSFQKVSEEMKWTNAALASVVGLGLALRRIR